MIRLTKTAVPAILEEHWTDWTQTLLEKCGTGEKPTQVELGRYNHPDIKNALLAETHSKCAYCESKVRHVTYGDVEHITPKSSAPERRFEWANLTIACDVCNTNKLHHEDVLDPHAINPEDHLAFEGPFVWALDNVGQTTELRLKLNRLPLIERRTERARALWTLIALATAQQDEKARDALVADITQRELAEDSEYTALSRTLVARYLTDQT